MNLQDLKVHSINVKHQPAFNNQGNAAVTTQLSYHVGTHGPFYHTYAPGEASADKMKADIQGQVAQLADLHALEA